MKRKSLCQSCGERSVGYERVQDLILVDACACGALGYSVPACSCEGFKC